MQTRDIDGHVSARETVTGQRAETNFFTQHLPRYRIFRMGAGWVQEAKSRDENRGNGVCSAGIEPIVMGSHKLKQED